MEDACSHAGGPLSEGTVLGDVVECPWHGSRFCLADGSVVRGPATFPQLRLEARVSGGRIEVRGRQG
jgi:nitrite reductase/ring-hydroxylating ferredoxin subunit